jgi:hypothetical protein
MADLFEAGWRMFHLQPIVKCQSNISSFSVNLKGKRFFLQTSDLPEKRLAAFCEDVNRGLDRCGAGVHTERARPYYGPRDARVNLSHPY